MTCFGITADIAYQDKQYNDVFSEENQEKGFLFPSYMILLGEKMEICLFQLINNGKRSEHL